MQATEAEHPSAMPLEASKYICLHCTRLDARFLCFRILIVAGYAPVQSQESSMRPPCSNTLLL